VSWADVVSTTVQAANGKMCCEQIKRQEAAESVIFEAENCNGEYKLGMLKLDFLHNQ